MKKNSDYAINAGIAWYGRKIFLKMRLTVFILLYTILQVTGTESYSQATKLSLNFKNVTLKEVLTAIEEKTEYFFMYSSKMIDVERKIEIVNIEKENISETLNKVLEGTGIKYTVKGRQILLSKENVPKTSEGNVQQQKSVSGKVSDSSGVSLPGVSVVVKGTTHGSITDSDGNYSISNVPGDAVLQFSFVGMTTQEVLLANKTKLNITLFPSNESIDEVVVVGYGTQKKSNLTGAVQQVTSKELENRTVINVGQALQGLIPNLNISISNGRANTAPNMNIRGMGSLSGNEPLIVIDGVPSTITEFMAINSNDIENVSALMDASSASIYGARAAFGVILVTTKKASKNEMQVTYNSNVSFRRPTVLPDYILDQNIVMRAKVDASGGWYNLKDIFGISDWDYLDKVTKGEAPQIMLNPEDPTKWITAGRTNWYKEAMRDYGVTQNHNVAISGTSSKTRYYVSGAYSRQEGVFKYGNDIFDKYNFREKVDFDVTQWLTISNNISYNNDYFDEPSHGFSFYSLLNTPTLDVIKNPDGSWTQSGATIFGSTIEGGRTYTRNSRFSGSFSANANFFDKMLIITAKATFLRGNKELKNIWIPVQYKTGPNVIEILNPILDAQRDAFSDRQNVFDLYADFTKSFNQHNFHALVGYNQEYRYSDWFASNRNGLITSSVPSISLATGDKIVNESATDWATRSGFFRLTYDFNGKYLFEVNGRYDGTSRFPKKDRFVFVPSMSVGWNIMKENFFAQFSNVVSSLKPRFSYGVLGNQDVSAYAYLATMSAGTTGSILAGDKTEQQTTIYAPGIVGNSLTWEKVKTTNIGVDFGFLDNHLNGTFDYYNRAVLDMLTKSKTLPGVLGTSEPLANAADLVTKGWEISITWKDNFKLLHSDFNYSVSGNLSDSRAWITKYDNPDGRLSDWYAGYEVGTIWGYQVNGLFQTQEELANHADQSQFWTYPGKVTPGPGDIKFEDLNGDGRIRAANTIYDMQDQKKIGNSRARYNVGLRAAFDWKGFDFSMFIQGVLKQDWYPSAGYDFWGLNYGPWGNLQRYQYENSWTPEHTDAYLPRIKGYAASTWSGAEMLQANTRYLQNNAYLRLRNISFGYSLPVALVNKIKLNQLRFFISGDNQLTWTGFKVPNIDPETSFGDYPLQKMFSCGINVKF